MLLERTDNIRDVIAFPKIAGGFDPLTDAPTPVDAGAARDLGLGLKAPACSQGAGDRAASGPSLARNDASDGRRPTSSGH